MATRITNVTTTTSRSRVVTAAVHVIDFKGRAGAVLLTLSLAVLFYCLGMCLQFLRVS